jgi:hypothetical protein
MHQRFAFEAPSLRRKVALTLKAPLRWRSEICPWVFDKKSGARFQMTEAEDAALRPLTSRLKNGDTRFEVATAFDEAADALMERRCGYCFEWNRLAQRTPADWEDWLSGSLRRLRW